MFSELTQAEMINGAVLVATLHGDLGTRRKIGPMRLLRPALSAVGIVPCSSSPSSPTAAASRSSWPASPPASSADSPPWR